MTSQDEDPVDELRGVGMNQGAALSRVAETLIRNEQDQNMRQAEQDQREAQQLHERYEAQALAAEAQLDRGSQREWLRESDPGEVAATWRAAENWAEVERDRFGERADAVNEAYRAEYGIDLREVEETLGSREMAAEVGQARVEQVRGTDREGAAYDTSERRAQMVAEMHQRGVPSEARDARLISDYMNGRHPHEAAGARTEPRRVGRARFLRGKQHDRQPEPEPERG